MAVIIRTMSSAERIIELFGGIRSMARTLNLDPASVWRWKQRGIPSRRWKAILKKSEKLGIKLSFEDLCEL